jgi:type VI secretion system protein ImpM
MFGKLPMKRDFISVETPREFLGMWEQWLQGGVAASRIKLGHGWRDAFLRAPIWRFWLSPQICGLPVMGSFMSSVDGVGRFFPLTIMACGAAGDAFPPPSIEPQTAWFGDVEHLLLGTLEDGAVYDTCLEILAGLPLPARVPAAPADPGVRDLHRAMVTNAPSVDKIGDGFDSLLAERERRMYAAASFWWTIGGDDYEPTAFMSDGLPDPNIVTSMLNGDFGSASG